MGGDERRGEGGRKGRRVVVLVELGQCGEGRLLCVNFAYECCCCCCSCVVTVVASVVALVENILQAFFN